MIYFKFIIFIGGWWLVWYYTPFQNSYLNILLLRPSLPLFPTSINCALGNLNTDKIHQNQREGIKFFSRGKLEQESSNSLNCSTIRAELSVALCRKWSIKCFANQQNLQLYLVTLYRVLSTTQALVYYRPPFLGQFNFWDYLSSCLSDGVFRHQYVLKFKKV